MKIVIAKTAGFCMGVRRAVDIALDAANNHQDTIFTYGPLIHNSQVLDILEEKGISILNAIPEKDQGIVIIRAHGIPPDEKEKLKTAGFKVIDATCPKVIRVQTIIRKHAQKGYTSIIVGDADHPEVRGLFGYSQEQGVVINSMDEFEALPKFEKAIIVAQTTQNTGFYQKIKEKASTQYPEYKLFDTICDSTERRQAEIKQLAKVVDAVVVVGGANSGNTKRLAEIAAQEGKRSFHIETETDIRAEALIGATQIGISAGASTPNWIIKKVYRELETFFITQKRGWQKALYEFQKWLLLTNILIAVGAGFLTYTSMTLQSIKQDFIPTALTALTYILSMHVLNNLTGRKEDLFNDPERADFYKKHIQALTFLALCAGGVAILNSYVLGPIPFITLTIMSILGLSYNLKIVPKLNAVYKYRRIKDIPASKTILITLAWGSVTSLVPYFAEFRSHYFSVFVSMVFTCGMVFVRSCFFDILAMQGDRIVGKETIPILLGEKLAKRLLDWVLLGICLVLFLSCFVLEKGILPILLIVCPLFLFFVIKMNARKIIFPGIKIEFLIDSQFLLAGLVTLGWALV